MKNPAAPAVPQVTPTIPIASLSGGDPGQLAHELSSNLRHIGFSPYPLVGIKKLKNNFGRKKFESCGRITTTVGVPPFNSLFTLR